MATWLISDLHFYHANVVKYCNRPYSSVEEMNSALAANWNNFIFPNDTVYCLGDFSMAFRSVETFTPLLSGHKFLVPGNHDFCHSYHKKSKNKENQLKWIKSYESFGWNVLSEQTVINIEGIGEVNVCHHPYSNDNSSEGTEDGYEDKYAKWRPIDDGKPLLCGHVHNSWKTKVTSKGSLMINVGVDVWGYRPVSLDQIKTMILFHKS